MQSGLFTAGSRYRKPALAAAIAWTAVIFVLCLLPSKELPQSDIPFIDKWTHFILFGVFSFLWLCANPAGRQSRFLRVTLMAVLLGAFIECLQSWLPRLGRTGDVLDAVADAVGGILGALCYWMGMRMSR